MNKIENWEILNKKLNIKKLKLNNSEKFSDGYGLSHGKIIPLFLKETQNKKKNYESVNYSISSLKLIHSIYSSNERSKIIKLASNYKSKKLGI